ncbi:MAG: membrane protein insertase YidC [Candidatus Acidiferrales bacterium]
MKEIEPEHRAFVAIILTTLVLLVWGFIYKPKPIPQDTAQTQAPTAAVATPVPPRPTPAPAVAPVSPSSISASAERSIVVESKLYHAELSNQGGILRSWQLKKFFDDSKPPKPLDLVNTAAATQLGGWPLSLVLDDPKLEAQANSVFYQVKQGGVTFQAPVELDFEWSDGSLDVTKRLKFDNSYDVELEVSATLEGKPLAPSVSWRGGFGDTTVDQAAKQVQVFYQSNGKLTTLAYNKLGVSGNSALRFQLPGALGYAGIEDRYFAAAFLPNDSPLTLWDWSRDRELLGADNKMESQPVAEMAAGPISPGPLSARVFIGPKSLDELNAQRPPLEDLLSYGWFGIISKGLLIILKWFYRYIPNYGWDIVLMTFIINMLLYPLKHKSWRSMQKMQKLAPRMDQIKQKYAKYSMRDPRKRQMNEEMMKLYNEEGINPMGSCLPMLFQMPVWWALYRMLYYSIELRHAPWFGWIHDLSAKDPYYILPILMVITMYITTKMTPQMSVDPAQQKMQAYMPVLFGIFFFLYSSGLILYIFTSNVVGMAQQWYLNRTEPLPPKGKARALKKA